MKKIISALFAFMFIVSTSAATIPKTLDDSMKLPMDTAVRHGILPNGLTYYIRSNSEPKNRADFYIAQKVGSIQEDDNQRGLAHFLEHMAFNGTTNFPQKTMLEYLQNNGIRFGADINAYTSFDETVYYISNVPCNNVALMDSVMLAVYDWGSEISLLDEEIEKERGVIHEEWRTRSDAQMRMFDSAIPQLYKGSKYAYRMPIGTMDVVMNFKPEDLRKYYETWYRPDQQGIIIVGDFNADQMEAKVKALFSKSTMPANPKPREYYPVLDNKKPIYALYTDPESPSTSVYLFFKHDKMPASEIKTLKKTKMEVLNLLAQIMLSDRFTELAQKPTAAITYAYGYDSDYFISKTKDAYTLVANAKEGKSLEAFETLLREAQRVREHGFTPSELERAKSLLATSVQNQYMERNKQGNSKYAQEYVNAFTAGEAIPGIEFEYAILGDLLQSISITDINNFFTPMITTENIAIAIFGHKKEGLVYPTEKEVLKSLKNVLSHKTTAYVDEVTTTPLLTTEPVAGKIVSEKKDDATNITELKLSNGATVYLKPTDFRNDEIMMSGISYGGEWAYKGENAITLKTLESVVATSALGNYTRTNLRKYMADKNVSIDFSLGKPTENINGNCIKKDLETLLQLNYLYFTDIRKDNEAFEALKSGLKSTLSLQKNHPDAIFSDSLTVTLFGNIPMSKSLTVEDVDKIDYDNVLTVAKERLCNAGDFSFSFVGNFDVDSIKPYIEKYIASLPDNGKREEVSYQENVLPGKINNVFSVPMETPKTTNFAMISGSLPYNIKNVMMLDILKGIMRIVYTNTIREEEGGTYSVSASASLSKYSDQWMFSYGFDTNVESQKRLNDRAFAELYNVIENGAKDDEFKKAKEALIKQYEISLRSNKYWLGVLRNKGIGIDIFSGYEDLIKNITLDQFNAFIKILDKKDNYITVIMNGTKR